MATTTSRPKPQVMRLSDAAADRLKEIMSQSDHPVAGLRVGLEKGGCAGMSYTMEYAEAAGPHDEIVEDKGVRVFVDPKAVLYLLGTEMDYQVDKFTAGFVFNNPNQTATCGCGHSVELAPAKV
jgi:iron-sulfur cluster assembly protein